MATKEKHGRAPLRSQRLGVRSNKTVDRLAAKLGLSRAATERVAVDRLAQDHDFAEELRAYRAGEDWRQRQVQTFGARAQLDLQAGESAQVRSGHVVTPLALTLVHARPLEDGRRALDLQIAEGGEILVLEALRVTDGQDRAILPLGAVHLATPVPPAEGEVIKDGPEGEVRTVWTDDGRRLTYCGTARFTS